jgi:hypothetical protein
MKKFVTVILSLVIVSYGRSQKELPKSENLKDGSNIDCDFVFGPAKAIECAHVADDISGYDGDWPPNTNSTLFFKLIEGNLKLKSINFCGVFIDSLTSSIGRVPNLETLQLSRGNITYIPKEIGKLKKLKSLTLGNSTDECRGNKVKIVPKEIGKCESLEYLGLAYSEVSDLPKELENCKKLKTIDLSYNKIITKKTLGNLKQRFPNTEIIFKQ